MYQPRHHSDADLDVLPLSGDAAVDAAFQAGPRRAVPPKGIAFLKVVVPGAVALAMAASGGVAMANQTNSTATVATPALETRTADALSRDVTRPAPAKAAKPTAKASWSAAFGKVAGTKFAQENLYVRAGASTKAERLGKLEAGDKVTITDRIVNGFREVSYEGKVGFVRNAGLGAKAPKVEEAPVVEQSTKVEPVQAATSKAPRRAVKKASAKSNTNNSNTSTRAPKKASTTKTPKYSGSTTYSGKRVLGLTPKAMVVYNAVMGKWGGQINSVGGYRSSSRSDHQYGRAIDFMITPGAESALGWSMAKYLAANAGTFGIDHIIFEQKIWTPYKPYWRPMENRGSVTANHYDHVHVSV